MWGPIWAVRYRKMHFDSLVMGNAMEKIKELCNRMPFGVLVILTVTLLLEVFVFNYRHWQSAGNSGIPVTEYELGWGYTDNGNGTYTVGEGDLTIEIKQIDCELKTAFIDMAVLNRENDEISPVTVRQWVSDESHKLFYGLPQREIWEKEKRSSYMTYHLYGKCTGLKIVPELTQGQVVSFAVTLNPRIPFFLSFERMLAVLLLLGSVYVLRPASGLHRIAYIEMDYKKRNVLLVSVFLLHTMLFGGLTGINPYFQQERGVNQKQYQALAESLKAGSFSLLEEPSLALQNMENPYDYEYRAQVMSKAGQWFNWDHAYYDGKYYVYFGVVPAVIFYLPCYLLSGGHLHNHTLVFLLALLFLAGVMGVIHELIKKWFRKTSLAVWFLLTELVLLGSGILYMTKRPDLYTVPILSGLAFGMLGFWCFLLADSREGSCVRYLCAGSLFTALTAGCRPQLFLFVLLFAVLFRRDILSVKLIKEKQGRKAVTAFLLPMALVAGGLMYYNYSRFGSVFDFGANYNLTFNDMRRRGWHWDRIPLGIVAYLFQPVKLITRFPFTEATFFDSQYMGVTIQEATYGGLFMTNLFAWFGILPLTFRKQFKKSGRTPWLLSVVCLLTAAVIIIADTNMSGILQRYFSDFSIFIMLASAVAVLLMISNEKIAGSCVERAVVWALILCLMTALAYQGMVFFLDTGEALCDMRPDLYSHVKYLTAFWL